ncbi:GmrSD restriction endonuclease domain-containing protein [Verrucomicrobiota bacterium sgz303538]
MPLHVNLDAIIPREDFEVISDGSDAPSKNNIQINELQAGAFFFEALRKPDFQRETSEWDPKRVVGLIRTFIDDELIPGVILWQNKGLLFVIDGSHRLSALIAWVQDDYGDGSRSQKFFNHTIPEEQLEAARRTRELVEKEFGSYKSHQEAIANPAAYGPDTVARARRFGTLSLQLQWVRGNVAKAEDSFVRINQQAAMITPQELELIQSRKKPDAIAARAIIRRGTGHQYWSAFAEKTQQEIKAIATELHKLIFEPRLRYPIKSLSLPAGGADYSAQALRMVFDFITLCQDVPAKDDDSTGERTVEYLKRCRHVMHLILSNHPSSLGLHPAIYFYSWTGKQQPILFLTFAALMIDLEQTNKLDAFIQCREQFEGFLLNHRSLVNQIIRKFGTKESGAKHLRQFYKDVLDGIAKGRTREEVVASLVSQGEYSYLQPSETAYETNPAKRFSTQVKSGILLRELIDKVLPCPICKGLVPEQAISIDHKERMEVGGESTLSNAQVTHPYCNTGYKEKLSRSARKQGA